MIEVAMQRKVLTAEPIAFAPPDSLRGHECGDVATWLSLQASTGIYPPPDAAFYRRRFGLSVDGRQFFVMHGDQPVATGTAWHGEPLRTPDWGRLHRARRVRSSLSSQGPRCLLVLGASGSARPSNTETRRRIGQAPR